MIDCDASSLGPRSNVRPLTPRPALPILLPPLAQLGTANFALHPLFLADAGGAREEAGHDVRAIIARRKRSNLRTLTNPGGDRPATYLHLGRVLM